MPSMGVLADARVVIVGAGAVGSCAAYRLAQAGAAVTVVEGAYPGAMASGNSFAWLNAFAKYPRHYYRLNLDSIRAHRDLEWELTGNWLTLNGGLHWMSQDGRSQYGHLEEAIRRLQSWGARVETYKLNELAKEEPGLSLAHEGVDTVFLIRDEGWVQPALMIRSALGRAVGEYKAELVRGTVVELLGPDGEVNGVALADGQRLEADVVLVAAGAATAEIAAMAGSSLPIETSVGVLAVTAPAPAMLNRVVIAPDISLRPDGGGRILASSEALSSVPPDTMASDSLPSVEKLRARLLELVPDLRGVPFESFRTGVRVLPGDGFPIVGFDPQVSGLYYAVMHSGITLSAGIADLIVDDLRDPDFDGLDNFRPDRFVPGRTHQGPSGE